MITQLCWKIREDTIINNMFAATGIKCLNHAEVEKYEKTLRENIGIGKHSRNTVEIISLSKIAYNLNFSPFPDSTRGLDSFKEVFSGEYGTTKIELIKCPEFDVLEDFDAFDGPELEMMFAEEVISEEATRYAVNLDILRNCYGEERTEKDRTLIRDAFVSANEEFAEYYNNKYQISSESLEEYYQLFTPFIRG